MTYLYTLLLGVVSTYSLWIFYLAVMNLKRARDAGSMSIMSKYLGTPILVVGYLLDAFVNVFVMTLILLEFPRETTVTARLKRHIRTSEGWRLVIAAWFIPLLDPYDPSGHHITEQK